MNFFSTLAVASIVMCAAPAFAQQASDTSAAPRMAHARVQLDPKLRMTDEQRQKLFALRNQYILDTANQKAQLKVAKSELRQTMSETTINKSAAQSLQSKINGLKSDLSNARLTMRLAAADVFTPEQREQFQSMRKRWNHHRGGGKFHGGNRCFGKQMCSPVKAS
jgi:periplasmic protein CpxP/Spy